MKNRTEKNIKIQKLNIMELKKCVKRILAVFCYGLAVFNMAIPESFWSLPFIVLLCAIYSVLPNSSDKRICISELAMSLVFKITLVYVVTVCVFDMGFDYMQYVCLVLWAVEGILYCVTHKKNPNINKLYMLFLSTMMFIIGTSLTAVVKRVVINPIMVFGVFSSIAVLAIYVISMREELVLFLRKYFHNDINIKDEY